MSTAIKNISTQHSLVDCYFIKANGEWSHFFVDKWPNSPGFTLSIYSSFGAWGHGWNSPGEDWMGFLKSCDQHYLGKKFQVGEDFDEALFEKKMENRIAGYLADESISPGMATAAREDLKKALEDGGGDRGNIFRLLYHESESGFYDDSEMFDCGDIPSRQWTAFYGLFWPLFIQAMMERKADNEKLTVVITAGIADKMMSLEWPSLKGLPTHTTAVDGRVIHVGDVCCHSQSLGTPIFTIVFTENAIYKKWLSGVFKNQLGDVLASNDSKLLNPITILKKYNEQ